MIIKNAKFCSDQVEILIYMHKQNYQNMFSDKLY